MCRWIALVAVAATLAGCEVYAVPEPETCPGTKVGTLNFNGTLRPSPCAFTGNGTIAFTGTVTTEADGRAWLCIDQPHAEPRRGTYVGDTIDVSYTNIGASVNPCTCPVDVLETVQGTLHRGTSGLADGFDGGMTSAVSPTLPDAGPAPDGGVCGCNLPCTQQYDLTAQMVGLP